MSFVMLSGCSSKPKSVTITIDGNGHDFKEGAVTVIENYDIANPLTIHPEHYFESDEIENFRGWSIDDDTTIISGQKIPVEKSITLYAQWDE